MNSTNASNTAGDLQHSGKQQQVQKFKLSDLRESVPHKGPTDGDASQTQADLNYEEDDEREHTLEDQVIQIVASPYQESIFQVKDSLDALNEQPLSKNLQGIAGQIQKVECENSRQLQSILPQAQFADSLEELGAQMAGTQEALKVVQVKTTKLRFNGPTSNEIPSRASAFSFQASQKQTDSSKLTQNLMSANDLQIPLVLPTEVNNDFRISENILKIFSSTSKEVEEQKENHKRFKRREGHLLPKMMTKLVETMQKCNPRYSYFSLLNPKRDLTVPSEGVLNNGYDNIENDYILRVGDNIMTPENKEYEIMDLMGKGTFGQVVKCECKQAKEQVAIKVIKNKKAFKNQGVIEIKILDILSRVYDPNGESPLVRMLDFFVFRDHLCIVFELLSDSLYDLIKNNQFQGISLNFSRLIISNILEGMKVIKEARLIHCDLKPENILFKSRDNLNLKIIDLGSACFEGFAIFQYIQSRYYRSPEVLLGLPYDSSIDMWSLGCICAELFLGIPIFPGNSEYDQLSRIIEILGPPPQLLIQKCRNRDKYFYYCNQSQIFRFKTFEHFQESTGIRLEFPKKYIQLNCLDDLKVKFIQKKSLQEYEKAQREGRVIDPATFQPTISESELNSMEAFIDFLKGVLRIDKDTRWTPNMAMEHPFIKRHPFTGPFDPAREQEKNSTNETGEDTMSEQSSSSRDSKEYKYGSCPSKILYPQTAALPQYLQSQPSNFLAGGQANVVHGQTHNNDGSEFVFHGTGSFSQQSHRPPILSIPDEFFKGFMFGRLDQILSMTRDQLYQFLAEQNEIIFRQHAQKVLMQQKMLYLQQQQMMMMNSQNQMQGMPMNPMMQHQMQQQFIMAQQYQKNQMMNIGQPPIQHFQTSFNQQQQFQQPMHPGSYEAQVRMAQAQQQVAQHQIGVGGGQFIQAPAPGQWMMNQQYHQQPPPGLYQQQQPQKFMLPAEQIINPPPYQQLKQQLYLNNNQMNDPQYQQMLLQQHQKRSQGVKNQRFSAPGQQTHLNKGKPGSWQPNQGVQGRKYNQYYNQINNPGQIIGRAAPNDQAQFAYFAAQQNQQHKKQVQNQDYYQSQEEGYQQIPKATFSNNDFKKKKHGKYQQKHPSQDYSQMQQIEEEKYQDSYSNQQHEQFFNPRANPNEGLQPQFPPGLQRDISFQDQMQFNQPQMMQPPQPDYSHMQQTQQPAIHHQFTQKMSLNVGQKPFQSPKFQQQDPNSFIGTQKSKSMSTQLQPQVQPNVQVTPKLSQFTQGVPITQGPGQKISNSSLNNQSVDSQNLNSSFQNNSSMSIGQKNSGPFLNKFQQNQGQKQQQTGQPNQDKTIFNKPNHHFAYQKHMLGINQGALGQSFVSNNQSNNSVVLSSRNRSNSDQLEDQLNISNLSQSQIQPMQTSNANMTQQINVKEYMVAPGQAHLQLSRNQIKFQNTNESFQGQDPYTQGSSVDMQEDAMSNTSQSSSTKVIGFQALKEQIKKQSQGGGGGGNNNSSQQLPHSAKGQKHFRFDSFNPSQPEAINFQTAQMSQGMAVFTPQNFKKSQNQQNLKQGQQQNYNKPINPIQTLNQSDQGYYLQQDQQQRKYQSSQDFSNQSFEESPLYPKQGFQQNQNAQVYSYPQQTRMSYELQVQQKQQQYISGNQKVGMYGYQQDKESILHSQSSFKDLTPIDEDQGITGAIASQDEDYRTNEHHKDRDRLTQQIGSQIYTDSEEEEAQSGESDEDNYQ